MGISIEATNKQLLGLVVALVVIAGVGYVYSQTPNPGHTVSEIEFTDNSIPSTALQRIPSSKVSFGSNSLPVNVIDFGGGFTVSSGDIDVYENIVSQSEPTANNHVATKGYVDTQIDALDTGPGSWDCITVHSGGSSSGCPTGYNLITGGCGGGGDGVDLLFSYPVGNGWNCVAYDGQLSVSIDAYARCCR